MYSEVHTVLLWSASDCKTKSLVGETSVHHLNSFEEDEIMMKDILALTRGAIFVTTLTFLVIIFVNIWTNIWTNNSLQVESSLKCGCSRIVKNPKFFNTESTCDSFSSFRPNGQKIVSYSYFGKSDERTRTHYLDQIRYRAQEISVAYSDFVMRIYYHIQDEYSKEKLCDVWCENENVDLCDVENLPTLGDLRSFQPIGRTWRFAAMLDPKVDIFMSRDLDSAILPREVSAVQEWLKSNRTFHIMRDHPSHNGYILAGLWGTKLDKNRREMVKNLAVNMLNSAPRNYWDFDQALLRRIVWPEAVKDSVQHDSYSCNYAKFNSFHSTKPFPTRRKNKLYVGWSPAKTNQTGIRPCPKQCRMDTSWIFC